MSSSGGMKSRYWGVKHVKRTKSSVDSSVDTLLDFAVPGEDCRIHGIVLYSRIIASGGEATAVYDLACELDGQPIVESTVTVATYATSYPGAGYIVIGDLDILRNNNNSDFIIGITSQSNTYNLKDWLTLSNNNYGLYDLAEFPSAVIVRSIDSQGEASVQGSIATLCGKHLTVTQQLTRKSGGQYDLELAVIYSYS